MKKIIIIPTKIDPNDAMVQFALAEHKRITQETIEGIKTGPMTLELKKEVNRLLLDDKRLERNLNNMLAEYKRAKQIKMQHGSKTN